MAVTRMTRSAILLLLSISLSGCELRATRCTGEPVPSPDGRCTAQQVQTLKPPRTAGFVDCTDGKLAAVIVIEGTESGIGFAWTGRDALDVAVPPTATVIRAIAQVPGSTLTVRVNVRPPYGTESTSGCGLEP